MKTPKKRVTLKTPKRSIKNTSFCKNTKIKPIKPELHVNKNVPVISDLDLEIKNTEKDLIESLQKENEILKNSNLYIKFLGLDITHVGDKYVIKYQSDKDNRFLHFELFPEEDMYVYTLVRSENIEELGVLGDEISFEKEQVSKFFYKVMEIMISD